MPPEKKYRQVQGLQSRNFRKNGNPKVCKARNPVKMAVRKISLPKFQENRPLQCCAKQDLKKPGFATMQHASGKNFRVCATLHTVISGEYRQVTGSTRQDFKNPGVCNLAHGIFR